MIFQEEAPCVSMLTPFTHSAGSISIEKSVTDSHQDLKPDWGQRILYAIDLETSMRGVGVRYLLHTHAER